MGRRALHIAVLASAMVSWPLAAALAGGLYLNEFNSPGMGVAGAGAQALANDASTAFHNPAGMDEDDRTPDMPIDRQIRYAIGAQYQWTENINVGASLVFIDMGDGEIDRTFLKGDYSKNYLFAFGLNLGWAF